MEGIHTVLIPEHSGSKLNRVFHVNAPNPEIALYSISGNEYSERDVGEWTVATVIDPRGGITKWRRSFVWALQKAGN